MTGLREYARDLDLPAALGDPHLAPPGTEDLRALAAEHLLAPGAPAPAAASCEYARWKPGVSCTAVYALELADGTRRTIAVKRYAGAKAASLEGRLPAGEALARACAPLAPAALVRERALYLAVLPADRVLPGLATARDARLVARILEEAGAFPARTVKRRRCELELLRYKPERRAVLALDLRLRTGGEERLAVRVLPPRDAAEVIRARVRLARAGLDALAPALRAFDERAGLLFEEWVPGRPPAPGPELDRAAGRLLAALHALPAVTRPVVGADAGEALAVRELLSRHPATARLARGFARVRSSALPRLCHGDFHGEQVLIDSRTGGLALLDLDCLGAGDPLLDLGSWLSETLEREPERDPREAGRELCEGYRGGGGERLCSRELSTAVAASLVRRGAGCLRRLEQGAVERALRLLELARELAPDRTVFA